jgi:16S rRNA (cytidine1402-2'-O)-methyltransferase
MTFRAMKILREADFVLAEDTRKTLILLKHYSIQTHLESYHKFNEHKITERIVERISEGKTVALVSDAGTPGISDPGFMLVRKCVEKGIEIECLPGATALIPAIINSGLPCDRFCFEGFLPQKKGRQKKLAQLVDEERTMIFYESPYRTLKCLEQFAEFFGNDRNVSVSRELSKIHEETVRGTLSEVIAHFKTVEPKGEIVIVLEGVKIRQP